VTGLRSGELAAAAGVNPLRVIKAAQRLGFTLDEVADLLDASQHRHGHRCDDLVACAAEPCCPIPFAGGNARPPRR
jgi:MerR family mercuric resistance operon transcriptional regulator